MDAIASPDATKLQLLIEALNAIFDIFAETQYNAIVLDVAMVEKLQFAHNFLSLSVHSSSKPLPPFEVSSSPDAGTPDLRKRQRPKSIAGPAKGEQPQQSQKSKHSATSASHTGSVPQENFLGGDKKRTKNQQQQRKLGSNTNKHTRGNAGSSNPPSMIWRRMEGKPASEAMMNNNQAPTTNNNHNNNIV